VGKRNGPNKVYTAREAGGIRNAMSPTHTNILIHALFSSKDRQPWLVPEMLRSSTNTAWSTIRDMFLWEESRTPPTSRAQSDILRAWVHPRLARHGLKDGARFTG
jgi:hypothetical protein